jgi:hypothetical protein
MCGSNGHGYAEYSFPMRDTDVAEAMGLIPVKLDFEGLSGEDKSRCRKERVNDKTCPPHVLSVSSRST